MGVPAMSHTRRLFVKKAITATSGLLAATCLLPKSYGFGCKSESRILGFGASDVDRVVTYGLRIDDWILGDCELKNVDISFQGDRGVFKGQVCTHFTHEKDVWHFRLKLFTGNPEIPSSQKVRFDQTWIGPQMSEKDNPLFHPWYVKFTFDPSINLGSLYGQAISCC
jgi:hypothetical protein